LDQQLKRVKEHFENQYYDEEMTEKLKRRVILEIHKKPKKFTKNYVAYFSSAAIITIGILIGSTYFSPTMASVMSNVPYFDEIFSSMQDSKEQEKRMQAFYADVNKKVSNNLKEGVIDTSLQTSYFDKTPTVALMVEDEKWKKEYENKFDDIVNTMAIKNQIGIYKIEVTVMEAPKASVSEEEKKRMEYVNKVFNIINTVLTNNQYSNSQINIDPEVETATIKVEFKKTDNVQESTGYLTEKIEGALQKENVQDLTVKVKKRSESEIRDEEWHPIFTSIMQVSSDKFSEVDGFAYSFHPAPLEIIIKTSLKKDEKEKAEEINRYVKQIIDVKKKEISIKDIPYKIIIRDKKHEKVYEKLYE
jgi:hypothetical protein